jgi:Helix-turn-helix domain
VSIETTKKRRARHVASDEAHAWARSLPLNNPNAKTVLRALALYVNGDGTCFVGIEQLAEDTDLSADTVRRRLVWLEQIGAIVRLPQWLDENGRRNGDGKGKRTSDEIRLLLAADIDEIERRALGEEVSETNQNLSTETTVISPSREQGLDAPPEPVSPQLAPRQPSQSCDHLISEPEPEESPQPPSGGAVALEGWKEFEDDWGEPILRQSIAQQVWAALKPDEREFARKAARGYAVWLKSQKRPPNRLSAHLFLRERAAWEGFAKRAPTASEVQNPGVYATDSDEGRAIIALYAVARINPFAGSAWVRYRPEITPQILAFAEVNPNALWIEDRKQIGAWSRFIASHVRANRPELIDKRGIGANMRSGIWAPHPWPPKVDGTWSPTGPPDPETLMRDEDYANI